MTTVTLRSTPVLHIERARARVCRFFRLSTDLFLFPNETVFSPFLRNRTEQRAMKALTCFADHHRRSIRHRIIVMPDNKLYDLLGVSRNASDQEIKKVRVTHTVEDLDE